MNRRIELYLGGQRADLSDAALVLMNYAATDLDNPTAVKNSYSKQIALPGTPANDAIFGHPSRVDRSIASGGSTGAAFNPSKRLPARIIDAATAEVLVEGYARLDAVKDGTYAVTLFGGLGEFFYLMNYNSAGERLSLADLHYFPAEGFDSELDFIADAASAGAAWRQALGEDIAELWDVINFAPCYNGIPAGNFDPGAAWYNGKLVKLAGDVDEWAAKDLRAYMQRPVIRFAAILGAIKRRAAAAGYTFDYSAVPIAYFGNLWKTLPMLSELGPFEAGNGSAALSWLEGTASFSVPGTVPTGMVQTATATLDFVLTPPAAYQRLQVSWGMQSGNIRTGQVAFFQLVGYAGGRTGVSPVKVLSYFSEFTPESLAEACGFTPWADAGFDGDTVAITAVTDDDKVALNPSPQMTCEAVGATSYNVIVTWRTVRLDTTTGEMTVVAGADGPRAYYNGTAFDFEDYDPTAGYGTVTWNASQEIRSGVTITKAMLLQGGHTPGQYLVGFAKLFGLMFLHDPAARTVTLLPREDFYTGEVVDLSERVDLSKEVTVCPQLAASQFYDLTLPAVGAFPDAYEASRGRVYGSQRIDTGYEFESAPADLLKGIPFKTAAEVLENGKYYNTITAAGEVWPSVLIDAGNTYDATGDAVPRPPSSAAVAYFNTAFPGYDRGRKLQLHDDKGGAVDGSDILLRLSGSVTYPHFALTDDNPVAVSRNGGKAPWNITPADGSLTLPVFTRYIAGDGRTITDALDMGTPQELLLPGYTLREDASLYERRWRAYLTDRLDADTKVLRCRVRLEGWQVTQALLRPFYWYGGALWVLNKITNHSLTTDDPTECEFIQVQDVTDYTRDNG